MVILTQAERDKFAAWLEQSAESNMGLVEQMDKMGGIGIDAVSKRMKQRALMYGLVADELRSIESGTMVADELRSIESRRGIQSTTID